MFLCRVLLKFVCFVPFSSFFVFLFSFIQFPFFFFLSSSFIVSCFSFFIHFHFSPFQFIFIHFSLILFISIHSDIFPSSIHLCSFHSLSSAHSSSFILILRNIPQHYFYYPVHSLVSFVFLYFLIYFYYHLLKFVHSLPVPSYLYFFFLFSFSYSFTRKYIYLFIHSCL